MNWSHEKAVKSAFSVCSHLFNRLIYSAYLKFSVYRPITRTEVLDENHHCPTLSKTTPPEPMLEHAIRLRAYELYAQRGTAEGHAVQDWLEAEAELLYDQSTTAANLNQELKR